MFSARCGGIQNRPYNIKPDTAYHACRRLSSR